MSYRASERKHPKKRNPAEETASWPLRGLIDTSFFHRGARPAVMGRKKAGAFPR